MLFNKTTLEKGTSELCPLCGSKRVQIFIRDRSYEICPNPRCKANGGPPIPNITRELPIKGLGITIEPPITTPSIVDVKLVIPGKNSDKYTVKAPTNSAVTIKDNLERINNPIKDDIKGPDQK